MAYALKNIGDRVLLSRTSLAKLTYIERMASEDRYCSHLFPRGLALHDVLIACVDKVCKELVKEAKHTRACNYLRLVVEGFSCREIGKQLGLSREHVSRVYRKKAIELVTEEFIATLNSK
jgi:DNA-binding NarL/FixJ family response regulator